MSKIDAPQKQLSTKRVYSAQERENHLHAWESSGKSGPAYAREHGLSEKSLYSWRSSVNHRQGSPISNKKPLSFLPVSVVGTSKPQAATFPASLSMRFNGLEVYVSGLSHEDIAVVAGRIHKEVFNV